MNYPHLNISIYILFLIFILTYIYGSYLDNYSGITVFSQSIVLASPQVKLINDALLIYEILIFLIMMIKYTFWGLHVKTKYRFKQYEKKYYGSEVEKNRYFKLIIYSITLLVVIYLRYDLFIFSNGGNAPLMRGVLMKTDFFVYLYMIIGFLLDLFLFICAIFGFELSKSVKKINL